MRHAIVSAAVLCLASVAASAATPAASVQASPPTLRVDIQHSGDARSEHYALERVVVEPLPWPGNPAQPLDTTNRGSQKFEVVDPDNGRVLYSRGYSTVFGEWRTTDDAQVAQRSFQESLRFPMPARPVLVKVYGRDADNRFAPAWSLRVDPQALDVERVAMPASARLPSGMPIAIRHNGDPARKVDLLLLGDGYAADEMDKFQADARRLSDRLFSVSPFKQRASDFNVWALAVPVPESGVSRPSTGFHHASATGARYDIFGSERYILTLDNRAFREIAQYAPYEFVEIMVNGQTYGGGGIFGQFSTVAAGNDWANYVFVHEFGHHFAGLADEYYTSDVAYTAADAHRVEPWEPNVTALLQPGSLKWRDQVSAVTPLPTPWPKAEFEAYERGIQARRVKLRAEHRPEAEMSALFREEQAHVEALFADARHRDAVGAFEGANYAANGYYRPQMQCMMFSRADAFCAVCQRAIEDIIDLYAATP